MSDRRELYRSPNGDTWFLGREPANGHAFIIHQPNAPSGGPSALGVEDAERTLRAVKGVAGKRLTYKQPRVA
jgi:hypothetical protein